MKNTPSVPETRPEKPNAVPIPHQTIEMLAKVAAENKYPYSDEFTIDQEIDLIGRRHYPGAK